MAYLAGSKEKVTTRPPNRLHMSPSFRTAMKTVRKSDRNDAEVQIGITPEEVVHRSEKDCGDHCNATTIRGTRPDGN